MNNVLVIKRMGGGFLSVAPTLAEGGAKTFCGWRRLVEEVLRDAQQVGEHEQVTQIEISEQGITFTFDDKPAQ